MIDVIDVTQVGQGGDCSPATRCLEGHPNGEPRSAPSMEQDPAGEDLKEVSGRSELFRSVGAVRVLGLDERIGVV